MKTLISAALLCPALACAQATPPAPQMDLPRATLTIGMHHIDVQLAQTDWQRQVGLMHRRSMPEHEGMLFVFERPGVQCFWMKDTLIPLTAAFVADDGVIVNLADMQPRDERSHCPSRPVRHALEMNQGWFEAHGVKVGDVVKGLETVPNGEPKP